MKGDVSENKGCSGIQIRVLGKEESLLITLFLV